MSKKNRYFIVGFIVVVKAKIGMIDHINSIGVELQNMPTLLEIEQKFKAAYARKRC